MKNKFNAIISELISKKRSDNKSFLTREEYHGRLEQLNHAKFVLKTPGAKKSTKDYRMVRKYDTLIVNGIERLIKPAVGDNVVYYVTNDELFDILHWTHMAIGHGGRNRMDSALKSKYCNITNETIMAYLSLCAHCQRKSSNSRASFVSKPILHSAFNSRARIDLINMQSQHVNGFRFILCYADHLTKFVILKALTSKCAKEIARNLLDIFTTFGTPAMLHSDDGRKCLESILCELHSMWPDVKIVHGKSQQNQESIERSARDVKDMLASWMSKNCCKDWSVGLKFVQFQKNNLLNAGIMRVIICYCYCFLKYVFFYFIIVEIGKTPYEAMFGCTARIGLASIGVPITEIPNLKTEEDVEIIMQQSKENNANRENNSSTSR